MLWRDFASQCCVALSSSSKPSGPQGTYRAVRVALVELWLLDSSLELELESASETEVDPDEDADDDSGARVVAEVTSDEEAEAVSLVIVEAVTEAEVELTPADACKEACCPILAHTRISDQRRGVLCSLELDCALTKNHHRHAGQ